jgi:hypothetical protein
MRLLSRWVLFCCSASFAFGQSLPRSFIYTEYDPNTGDGTFVNSVIGWDRFFENGFTGASTVIGNLEAGTIWTGHDVFQRAPGATTGFHTYTNLADSSLNENDYHATMVGHVLAGSGYVVQNGVPDYTYAGLGMAPSATVISGGIAVAFSSTVEGSFETSEASVVSAYRAFFQGVGLGTGFARPDVINSSWGGGDSSAIGAEYLAMDGLARQNPAVAWVVSAGNSGTNTVVAPASGFNNISVGSVGGASLLQPSTWTSQGLADFYLPGPNGGTTLPGVRVAVDLAAPGETLFLAAYLGRSGSFGAMPVADPYLYDTPPTNRYFTSGGTSFSSPIVAGGIALLKDVANTDPFLNFKDNPAAFDTRVLKSVLMAGAQKTVGWNNGQNVVNAVNVTTQALDMQTGAGAMNLDAAANVYFFGTRDLPVDADGRIAAAGWDSSTILLNHVSDYVFDAAFTEQTELTVALNWFSVREFDNATNTATDIAFSNLDLQVWLLDGAGAFDIKVAESVSTYNNTEFLRLDSIAPGQYGLRVVFGSKVFDTTGAVNDELYGLAWQSMTIPESGAPLWIASAIILCLKRRRR